MGGSTARGCRSCTSSNFRGFCSGRRGFSVVFVQRCRPCCWQAAQRCRVSRTRCRRVPQRGGGGVGPAQCVHQKRRSGEDAILVQALKAQVIVVSFASSVDTDRSHGPQGMVGIPIPSGWFNVVRGLRRSILFNSPLSRMLRVPVEAQVAARQNVVQGNSDEAVQSRLSDWRVGISPTE